MICISDDVTVGLSKIPDEECVDESDSKLPASTMSHSTLTKVDLPPHVTRKGLRARRHTQGVGTRIYSSPEQLRGGNYCKKTDIYSLGIILMELFCPFTCVLINVFVRQRELHDGCVPSVLNLLGVWDPYTVSRNIAFRKQRPFINFAKQ